MKYKVTGVLSAVLLFVGAALADSGVSDTVVGICAFAGAVLAIVGWELYCARTRREAQRALNERLRG